MATPGRNTTAYRLARRQLKATRRPCYHCGQTIDYSLEWPDPGSFSVDHLEPISKRTDLADDPANMAASHLRCNMTKGDRDVKLGLGNRSEDF